MSNKPLILNILLLCAFNFLSGQDIVKGYVMDEVSNEPVSYAYIIKVSSSGGTITNEDGYFELDCTDTDSLEISFLGYEKVIYPIEWFKTNTVITLKESVAVLSQITVIANDDYLYNIIHQVRQNLRKQKEIRSSKAYLITTTAEENNPIELSEYFYNVDVGYGSIATLQYKNGQSYLAEKKEGGLFINLNISKAISLYSLVDGNQYFPVNPLELSRKKLRKNYTLELVTKGVDFVQIQFNPINNKEELFYGSIWVDPTLMEIKKIELNSYGNGNNLFRGILETKIEELNFKLTYSYKQMDEENALQFVAVKYDAKLLEGRTDISFDVETESILHRYDFVNKFEVPKIDYPRNLADYRFLAVSRDTNIWNALQSQSQVKLSERQYRNLGKIKSKGTNFKNVSLSTKDTSRIGAIGFFKENYQHWSPDTRIRLNRTKRKIGTGTSSSLTDYAARVKTEDVIGDFLNVKSVLYLDVIKVKGGLRFETGAILDPYHSYNHLEVDDLQLAYINICFDLTEVYRRLLQTKLQDANLSLDEVNKIYKDLNEEFLDSQKSCEKETDAGRKFNQLVRWNALISEELGVDNFDIFNVVKQ